MEEKLTKDSQPESVADWPAAYEPPSLEDLGSAWDETMGLAMGNTDVGGLTAIS